MKKFRAIMLTVSTLSAIFSYWLPDFLYPYIEGAKNYDFWFISDGMKSFAFSILITLGVSFLGNGWYNLVLKCVFILFSCMLFIDSFDRIVMRSNVMTIHDVFAVVTYILLTIPILWNLWRK